MPFIWGGHPEYRRHRRGLTAVLMRSGTSKGLFIHRDHLPASETEWSPIILSAMGSACGDKRQLDGVGGATPTTSKVAVVSKSKRPNIDVDYTFAQVAVGDTKIDMTGNCGNIASGVGPFALDEGLVTAKPGQTEVSDTIIFLVLPDELPLIHAYFQLDIRVFNTNTRRTLVETVQVDPEGRFLEEGEHRISGFAGSGSCIKMNFLDPGGSMTGKLFPSGQRQNEITVYAPGLTPAVTVRATLIDAANPFIFVDASTLPDVYHQLGPDAPQSLELIETIRRQGAVLFGLAPNVEAAKLVRGTPKIAVLSPPRRPDADISKNRQPDINVTAFSMGKVHPSLQLTGAVCVGAAASLPGTVAFDLSQAATRSNKLSGELVSRSDPLMPIHREVCIGQRGGQMLADVKVKGAEGDVEGVSVSRTAQRLFEGNVMLAA